MLQILIIDDTKSIHAFVKHLLTKIPSIVLFSVYDGEEALDLLKNKTDFDLILLDWEMPVLDGPKTFAEFLKLGVETPTVMMTTKNSSADIETMLHMGVAEYLLKPFTLDILLQKIEYATKKAVPDAA